MRGNLLSRLDPVLKPASRTQQRDAAALKVEVRVLQRIVEPVRLFAGVFGVVPSGVAGIELSLQWR